MFITGIYIMKVWPHGIGSDVSQTGIRLLIGSALNATKGTASLTRSMGIGSTWIKPPNCIDYDNVHILFLPSRRNS